MLHQLPSISLDNDGNFPPLVDTPPASLQNGRRGNRVAEGR